MVLTQEDNDVAEDTLEALFMIENEFGSKYMMDGHTENIKTYLEQYLIEHPESKFVGMAHSGKSGQDICLDQPHMSLWKNGRTTDYLISPTGLDTEDQVFPESGTLRLEKNPDHWIYLAGFIENGSARNVVRIYYYDINKRSKVGLQTSIYQSRLGDYRIMRINPAIQIRTRGHIRIDMEFETAAPTEIIPLACHILPYEIIKSVEMDGFVTTVAS